MIWFIASGLQDKTIFLEVLKKKIILLKQKMVKSNDTKQLKTT